MLGREQIKMKNESGEEKIYDIILSFDDDESGMTYIVYTENKIDDNGNLELLASKYDATAKKTVFDKIETEEEWNMINIVLDKVQESVKYD